MRFRGRELNYVKAGEANLNQFSEALADIAVVEKKPLLEGKNMFIIIGIMFAGMLLGFLLRKQRLSWIHKVITVFIWLLLFLLGIDVGSNQEIINGLHTIGLEAVILTLAAVLGSVTAAWALWYMVYKRNRRSEA